MIASFFTDKSSRKFTAIFIEECCNVDFYDVEKYVVTFQMHSASFQRLPKMINHRESRFQLFIW